MKRLGDYTNQKFGRLFIIEQFVLSGHSTARCICDCGNYKVVGVCDLIRGYTKSCGCLSRELTSKGRFKHGDSSSKEYNSWCSMKARCNENHKHKPEHKNWSGRGIKVCDRWVNSYENFLADMGRAPSDKHSIDRFPNNDGNYEPNNCRWATAKEQANNTRPRSKSRKSTRGRRITYNGITKSIKEWSDYLGISKGYIYRRMYLSLPIDEVLSVQVTHVKL